MVMQSRKRNGLTDGFFDSNATSNINISPVTTSNGNGGSARSGKLWSSSRSNGTSHKLSPRSRGDSQRSKNKSPKTNTESSHAYAIHKSAKRSVGPWSEHVSSSSKMYYFDWRTEVSQWDKPAIWLEDDKLPQERQQQLQKTKSPSTVHRTPSSSKSTSNSSNGSSMNRRDHHSSSSHDSRDNKYRRMSSNSHRQDDLNDEPSINSRLNSTATSSSVHPAKSSKDLERLQPHQNKNATSSTHISETKNSPPVDESSTSKTSSTVPPAQGEPTFIGASTSGTTAAVDVKDDINEKPKFDIKEDTRNMMSDQFKNFCDSSLIEHTANWLTNSFYTQTKVDRFQNMKLDYAPNFLKVKYSRAQARFHSTQFNHFEQKILFLRQRYDDIENGRSTSSSLSALTSTTCSSTSTASTTPSVNSTSTNLLPTLIPTQSNSANATTSTINTTSSTTSTTT